jgi:hypothetical protein
LSQWKTWQRDMIVNKRQNSREHKRFAECRKSDKMGMQKYAKKMYVELQGKMTEI